MPNYMQPNTGAISKVAGELNQNIFKPLKTGLDRANRRAVNKKAAAIKYTGPNNPGTNFRTTKAKPAAPAGPPKALGPGSSTGPKALPPGGSSGPSGGPASPFHPNFYNVRQSAVGQSPEGPKAITEGQRQITTGQKQIEAYKPAPKSGIATPYVPQQRVFEMGGGKNPVPKNLQATQRGLFSAGPYKTFPAKAPAVTQEAQMGQMKGQGHLITPGGNISKPALPPKPRNSLQFADTSTKDNSPFPTHQHPAGSSSAILPNLSANESAKTGRPNTFTMGSRNIKGGGIAAMGSQLEQSLAQRPLSLPEQNKRT